MYVDGRGGLAGVVIVPVSSFFPSTVTTSVLCTLPTDLIPEDDVLFSGTSVVLTQHLRMYSYTYDGILQTYCAA